MAWNNDQERILPHSTAHRLCCAGMADPPREIAVRYRFPKRNPLELLPDLSLECRAGEVQLQTGKPPPLPAEIFLELPRAGPRAGRYRTGRNALPHECDAFNAGCRSGDLQRAKRGGDRHTLTLSLSHGEREERVTKHGWPRRHGG